MNQSLDMDFQEVFEKKIKNSLSNYYGDENYDAYRFGTKRESVLFTSTALLKRLVKLIIRYDRWRETEVVQNANETILPYKKKLQCLYENLGTADRELLVSLLAYRILGPSKVKLPRNNKEYWKALQIASTLKCSDETHDPRFLHMVLEKFDLKHIGYNLK